jgi:hypothetical protein
MALLSHGNLADLFGRALLVRQWGRIGTEGRRWLDPYPVPAPPSTRWPSCSAPSAAVAMRIPSNENTAQVAPGHPRVEDWRCDGKSPSPAPQTGMPLHTVDGIRKYLTAGERDAFLRAAEHADRLVRALCMTLAYAGCRRRWR